MIKETLKIFSQNIRKNKALTDIILENNKNTTDIIFIQEPLRLLIQHISSHSNPLRDPLYKTVKDGIPEEREYKIIDRSYTPFQSNVRCWRRIYLAMIQRRLRRTIKDIGAENDLLNDLGFNLCVAPRSPVVRLVAYFGMKKVVKTEVLRSRVKTLEWTRED